MTLRDELSIPFQGIGEAVSSLLAGSAIILRAAGRAICWCLRPAAAFITSGKTFGDRLENAGILVLPGIVGLGFAAGAVYFVRPYAGIIGGTAAVAWVITAWALSPEPAPAADEDQEDEAEEDDAPENDQENQPTGEQPQQNWALHRKVIRDFVEAAVATAAAGHTEVKGKGARVDDILAALWERGSCSNWDRKAMMACLDRVGIRYREQMKFRVDGKQKNHPGVHIEDLTQDLGYTPHLPAYLIPDLTPISPPPPHPASPPIRTLSLVKNDPPESAAG